MMDQTIEVAQDRFKHFVTVSLAVHFGLLSLLFLRALVFPSEPIVFQPSIKVDLIGLPDKLPDNLDVTKTPSANARPQPPALPAPKPAQAPKPVAPAQRPAPPKAPSVNLNQARQNQNQALNRIEQMAALERLQQQQAAARAQAETRQLIRGDAVSEGTSLRGVARLEHEQYLGRVESQIRQAWALPPWLANKNHKARALVKIDRDGSLLSVEVIETSGENLFDDLVVDTIRKATPFPVPPDNIASVLRGQGIIFGFPE